MCTYVFDLVCASFTLPGDKMFLGRSEVFCIGLICQAAWSLAFSPLPSLASGAAVGTLDGDLSSPGLLERAGCSWDLELCSAFWSFRWIF